MRDAGERAAVPGRAGLTAAPAGLTAGHLGGPWVARRLDAARDGRRVLAAAFATCGASRGAAALALGRMPVAVAAAAVVVAGACGPLLTGGLSSRLAAPAGPDVRAQRRAQGLDATTYGLAGTGGPTVPAGLAALAGPPAGLLALAAASAAPAPRWWPRSARGTSPARSRSRRFRCAASRRPTPPGTRSPWPWPSR